MLYLFQSIIYTLSPLQDKFTHGYKSFLFSNKFYLISNVTH